MKRTLATVAVGAGFLGLLWLLVAGRVPAEEDRVVVVVGPSSFDFGDVRGRGAPVEHSFVLRNDTGSVQRVEAVSKSCGCLSATVFPQVLDAGATSTVKVSMDTRLVHGRKEARAFVRFENKEQPVIPLALKAYVEPEYKVVIEPIFVAVQRKAMAGERLRKRIRVAEYLSHSSDYERLTTISIGPDSPAARVERVEPWRNQGWRMNLGYVRTTEILVSYEVPREWKPNGLAELPLLFRKEGQERSVGGLGSRTPASEPVIFLYRM